MRYLLRARKIMIHLLLLICGVSAAAFISVRIDAVLILAWNIRLPIWSLWAFTGAFGILPAIFMKRLSGYLRHHTYFKFPYVCLIGLSCLVFCLVFRKHIVDEALICIGAYTNLQVMILTIGAALLLALFVQHVFSALTNCFPSICRWLKSLNKKDFIFLAAILIIINVLSWLYIKGSYKIYYWDSAGYWQITQILAEEARVGFVQLIGFVFNSIQNLDYNYLIALPWTPLVMIFGTSRWVFICGIVNFGLFPLLTLFYFYIRSNCRRKILAALCLFGTFPMLFITALVGYLDITGVIFILASILIWKYDNNKNDIGHFIIIGILLAGAALLRRWFCFFALSFILTLIVDSIIYRKSAVPVVVTLAAFGFSLLFLFQPFVSDVLLKNYSELYSAYKMGLAFDVKMFTSYFGLFTLAVAIAAGIFYCFKREKRQMALFLLLQIISCFLIFVKVQSHNQQHLLLYIPSLMLLMTMLICPLADALTKRRAAGLLLVVNTLLPSFVTVYPALYPVQIDKAISVSLLPSFSFEPWVWPDASEIVKIIRYLDKEVGKNRKTVGILACSFLINRDILVNAEASLNLKRVSAVPRNYLLELPAVDSRDPFPGMLFECDFLLVGDPIQLHLGKEKQQVVYLPAQMLLKHTGFGMAYEKFGEEFELDGGNIKLTLYKKTRALTEKEQNDLVNEFSTREYAIHSSPDSVG
jgi:hypothetical protein